MTTPGDDYRRQDEATRALIRGALDQTLFVEAGAGTGKTRALVDRVVALVLAGTPIERIVAITFTEKAAAELRDRVREELEAAQQKDTEHQPLVSRALASLDRAQISTIHSFAQTLLRSFAAEAGVDPDFAITDEIMAERRFQEQWRLYLDSLATTGAEAVIDRALSLGLTTRDLQTLASELTARAELAPLLRDNPPQAPLVFWPDLHELHQRLLDLQLDRVPREDQLRQRIDTVVALLSNAIRAGAGREGVLGAGAGILKQAWGVGRMENWSESGGIQRARDTVTDVCALLRDVLQNCRAEALAQLLPLVAEFVLQDGVRRGREGALTFDDLILRVRDLLQDQTAVRVLRDRYHTLLIDEFQDTDPLQVQIALAFATDPSTGRLEPGRLFLVGDPKQSIYRFRRADMAVYSSVRALAERQGASMPQLQLNQRSRGEVLHWVNSVCISLIGGGETPAVQPPYRPVYPVRDQQLRGPGVVWMGSEVEGRNARGVRQLEAEQLAAHCRAALDEGWEVFDRAGPSVRPAAFRDIAILIPGRSILAPLERALADASVPYRIEGGSLVYRTQDVRDLLNCLTAVDDPADEVAVVAALRSPAFACSDVDLARHRAANRRFHYLSPEIETWDGLVGAGLGALAGYHRRAHDRSIAALIEEFVAQRGLVEVGILDRGDRNSFRRARFVVEQARAFEASGPESLRSFLAWMEGRSEQRILDNEGAELDDDEDAVRVLTVHGAKGREFPIVFLAGLGSQPPSETPVFAYDRDGSRVGVCIGAKTRNCRFELGPVEELNHLEDEHALAEGSRVLYVAATRARDHLIVSLYHKRNTKCPARRLIEAGAQEICARRPELPSPDGGLREPFADLQVEAPGMDERAFAEARQALVARSRRKEYTSATALGRDSNDWKNEPVDETEPWSRGRGGSRLGRAVHAAIQSLPFDADDQMIAAFSRAQAVAEAIPGRAREVARVVARALASQAAARARSAPRALREVPFAVESDGKVVEGFIDLLIETADGLEIVDWKTDEVPPEEVPDRVRRYELQAGLYVHGIEAATGRRVRSVTYVFAGAGVELSPGEPAALAEAARARLAGG